MAVLNSSPIRAALAALALSLCLQVTARADDYSANALRGLDRLTVAVEGVSANFARYGLTADELARRVEARLAAGGIAVVSGAAAQTDDAVGQLQIELHTVESFYAYYSYAVSAEARRKLPISDVSFVSQAVWSRGQSGVINPSDLKNVYGYVDRLVDAFLAAYEVHNGPAHTVMNQ